MALRPSTFRRASIWLASLVLTIAAQNCGQDPSFNDANTGGGSCLVGNCNGGSGGNRGGDGTNGSPQFVEMDLTQQGPGKVDILWVIDSSGSMSEEQAYLGNAFNTFINTLHSVGTDFQTS